MRAFSDPLPIDAALPELLSHLAGRPNAVLVAPPGAGKTTRVPLALLDEAWTRGGRIIVLEPRRLAARAAAARMASTLGEAVGDTVGLRVRLDSRISARTRIEVVTEGVFARMILDDPSLDGIAAVLFDEFHERSLDADTGLAFALDAQAGLREDLRILPMSATIDGARVARLLGAGTPVVESEGRAFPVETRYLGRDPRRRIEDEVADAVIRALAEAEGSILAFLPGQGEIRRVERLLAERIADPAVDLAPLYGAMEARAQDLAVRPAAPGRRKIVLATSIAETSLTIEGVTIVVDSGLARVPRYRAGHRPHPARDGACLARRRRPAPRPRRPHRAGPLLPVVGGGGDRRAAALRPARDLAADLSPLLLDCAVWGVADPSALAWLDAPPAPAVTEARALLRAIEAIDPDGRPTGDGRRLQALSLPPRLARMVVTAARRGEGGLAADIAAVITERGLGGDGTDLVERVERFRRDRSPRAEDMRRLSRSWLEAAGGGRGSAPPEAAGAVLALAYPDRVAVARGRPGAFTMENGRGAGVEPHDRLAQEPSLAIAEVAGAAGAARILLAAPIAIEAIEALGGMTQAVETSFDAASGGLKARSLRRYRRLVFADAPAPLTLDADAARALAAGIARIGLDRLPWTRSQRQWRDRIAFLRRAEGEDWPDLSDAALAKHVDDWLAPAIEGRRGISDIAAEDLDKALSGLLPWPQARRLEAEAPTHFTAPTGSRLAIDYEAEAGPTVTVRVQELFGLALHPDHRRGPRAVDARTAFAGPPSGAGDEGPAGFLARLLRRRAQRDEGPLPEAPLAGGPRRRAADDAGQAAGRVGGSEALTPPSRTTR